MKSKVEQFKERNKKRNAHLYEHGLTQGHDYIVCPVSNERLSMIKSSYITKVLGMTVEKYDALYPGIRGVSQTRKFNIKNGLAQIDPISGLTKYELSQIKSREILKQIDDTGKSGYKRKGERTRATHMNNLDEFGRNGYSKLATKAILKGNKTKAEKGLISLNRNEFKRYKLVVLYLTEKFRKELTNGYITGLAGKEGAWHIDHRYSILKGYQNKVSPLIIGHQNNLEMVPWKYNVSKHSSCSINIDELLNSCGYDESQSIIDFNKFVYLINEDIKNNIPPNAAFLIERFYQTVVCG